MDISKKDWKLFREKLPDWQENYMDKLNKQYIELLSNEKETASDKFLELAKRIKNDRKKSWCYYGYEKVGGNMEYY